MTASKMDSLLGHNRQEDEELDVLADGINEDLAAHLETARQSLQRAMAAGDKLIRAKALLPHGKFLPWLEENCPHARRTAQDFMRIARSRELLEAKCAETAHLTTQAALKIISSAEPKTEPRQLLRPDGPSVLQPGDVVALGDHRLLCADAELCSAALNAFTVSSDTPRLLLCDPPYGVNHPGVPNDHRADWRKAWANYPGHAGFVFYAGTKADEVIAGLKAAGFEIRYPLVWLKPSGNARGKIRFVHESFFFVVRKGRSSPWSKDIPTNSVFEHKLSKHERQQAGGHTTPKPVALLVDLIEAASYPGDAILDPFAGSGSTLIACEETDRICLAVELDPHYCDAIVRRWQTHTGRVALVGQGQRAPIPFSELERDPALADPKDREQLLARLKRNAAKRQAEFGLGDPTPETN